jgi:hypothetical protein
VAVDLLDLADVLRFKVLGININPMLFKTLFHVGLFDLNKIVFV